MNVAELFAAKRGGSGRRKAGVPRASKWLLQSMADRATAAGYPTTKATLGLHARGFGPEGPGSPPLWPRVDQIRGIAVALEEHPAVVAVAFLVTHELAPRWLTGVVATLTRTFGTRPTVYGVRGEESVDDATVARAVEIAARHLVDSTTPAPAPRRTRPRSKVPPA